MEFGRAPGQIRNVLAVLGDGEEAMEQTLRAAVDLADAERARLTLVKTCTGGRAYVWIAPFAVGGAYLPPVLDSPEEAARVLSHAADRVPDCIPVTMLVLGPDTQGSLLKLLRSGDYGAIVAERAVLSHCRRVRRLLRRDEVQTILLPRRLDQEDAGTVPTSTATAPRGRFSAPEPASVSRT